MSNLRVIKTTDKVQNTQIVEYLKGYLERAIQGELTEMIVTFRLDNGEFENCWTGSANLLELVGVLERQKQLMLRRMD